MHEVEIGPGRYARAGYELDDLMLVPSRRTRDLDSVDVSWRLDAYPYDLPVVSAPMDAVTSPETARLLGDLGGQGVLNLEGVWTRYEDPTEVLAEIAQLEPGPAATSRLQEIYDEPVKEDLIGQRVEELGEHGLAAASLTPQKVERYHGVALEAGLGLLVVQGVVVTAQHFAGEDTEPLDLKDFTARYDIPVVVGGVASAKSAKHLMRTGAVGVLVGVGNGSVSTTTAALGVGRPQATAISDVVGARNRYHAESGRYVSVIAAGGIATGGDVAKSIALGADAVMLGRPLAAAEEAPGGGSYWGYSAAHQELPRGQLTRVGTLGTLSQVVSGPAHRDDGTVNLIGGLRRSMAVCGYHDLRDFQRAELAVRA